MHSPDLTAQALAIWQAGVDAVKPDRLIASQVSLTRNGDIEVAGQKIELDGIDRLVVVGAGKASAAMAIALERQILSRLPTSRPDITWTGWINCPEGSFSPSDEGQITLFAARPAGMNFPTEKAVQGTQHILSLLQSCGERDLVLCLLSGGGSALLADPIPGITLADKQSVAQEVAGQGGNIEQLNTVRRALSEVKAGGLARKCNASRMITLVLSDVLGDPLDIIASGPTYQAVVPDPAAALEVLRALSLLESPKLSAVVKVLQALEQSPPQGVRADRQVDHIILGNNATAVSAATRKAQELGFQVESTSAAASEGDVLQVAEHAQAQCLRLFRESTSCWISGGEPTVHLPKHPGKGGRNQQLCLAMYLALREFLRCDEVGDRQFTFVSGGTDGEDGPTKAAGAYFNQDTHDLADSLGLQAELYLEEANAYEFFLQTQGVLQVGPTGTNVCDLRVAVRSP